MCTSKFLSPWWSFLSQSFCSVLAFKSSACNWVPYIIFTLLWFPIIETYSSKADVHAPEQWWPHFSFMTLPSGHRRWTGVNTKFLLVQSNLSPQIWKSYVLEISICRLHELITYKCKECGVAIFCCVHERRESNLQRDENEGDLEKEADRQITWPHHSQGDRKSSLYPATFPIPGLRLSGSQCLPAPRVWEILHFPL